MDQLRPPFSTQAHGKRLSGQLALYITYLIGIGNNDNQGSYRAYHNGIYKRTDHGHQPFPICSTR